MVKRYCLIVAMLTLPLPHSAFGRGAAHSIETLPFLLGKPPAGLPRITGKLLHGMRWSDAKGENVALFSRRHGTGRTSYGEKGHWDKLEVRHYVRRTSKRAFRLVRRVRDKVPPCEFDITAEFVKESLGLTDLDSDGRAELTFAYRIGCRSDVSPVQLKLLVLEAGKKYILRGQTRVRVAPKETLGGKYKASPSFRRAPKAFLRHAERVWAKIAGELGA